MALAYLTLGERRFYTSSGTWPDRPHLACSEHRCSGLSTYRWPHVSGLVKPYAASGREIF